MNAPAVTTMKTTRLAMASLWRKKRRDTMRH
jgi:hypothetical protein